ncbi:MAG: T9SS type A sorting domain-containing protein [Balneolaceae bacterium]|nr:T9SS type A sorting domain-containing protein [Balneolaceae bacterium]MBO6546002.1 T9SS type A sorting domain-containing protein [Balneolaceae bacterium]MBO6647398.1 T9SS type A sorting domain-containing protein [Balneolaceae bacterium]
MWAFSGIVFLALISINVNGQTLISPLSGFQENGNISLAFSVGEVVSGDFDSESFSFTAGFAGINGGVLISNELLGNNLPRQLKLSQNYPNPFNPTTNIEFTLPKQAEVKLEVFNSIGMKVAVLVDENKHAGYHTARFDASSYSSGMYFYRLTADGNIVSTKKMILIK